MQISPHSYIQPDDYLNFSSIEMSTNLTPLALLAETCRSIGLDPDPIIPKLNPTAKNSTLNNHNIIQQKNNTTTTSSSSSSSSSSSPPSSSSSSTSVQYDNTDKLSPGGECANNNNNNNNNNNYSSTSKTQISNSPDQQDIFCVPPDRSKSSSFKPYESTVLTRTKPTSFDSFVTLTTTAACTTITITTTTTTITPTTSTTTTSPSTSTSPSPSVNTIQTPKILHQQNDNDNHRYESSSGSPSTPPRPYEIPFSNDIQQNPFNNRTTTSGLVHPEWTGNLFNHGNIVYDGYLPFTATYPPTAIPFHFIKAREHYIKSLNNDSRYLKAAINSGIYNYQNSASYRRHMLNYGNGDVMDGGGGDRRTTSPPPHLSKCKRDPFCTGCSLNPSSRSYSLNSTGQHFDRYYPFGRGLLGEETKDEYFRQLDKYQNPLFEQMTMGSLSSNTLSIPPVQPAPAPARYQPYWKQPKLISPPQLSSSPSSSPPSSSSNGSPNENYFSQYAYPTILAQLPPSSFEGSHYSKSIMRPH